MRRAHLLHVVMSSLSFGAGASWLPAQQTVALQMGVAVSPETVTVGDPFRVVVRLRAPAGTKLVFPAIDSVEAVEPIDPPRIAGTDSGVVDQSATYRMVAWETGDVPIPFGDVVVTTAAGERRVAIEGASVFVRSVLPPDTTQHVPKPPRDLMTPPVPWWRWWLIGAIAALLLALLAWAWWRRRRRPAIDRPVDPHEVASREFERIERMGLVESGERERYVALMVEVLRDYLARRLPDARPALTSSELLAAIRNDPRVPSGHLQPVLDESDLVKFARIPITADRAKELGKETRSLVERVEQAAKAREQAMAKAASERAA